MKATDFLLLIVAIALFLAGYSFAAQLTAYLLCVAVGAWAGLIAVRMDRQRRVRAAAVGTIAGVLVGALLSFLVGSL